MSARAPDDAAFEVTTLRPYYEEWVRAHDGRTAYGVSGVEQRRLRGAVRFLESYAAGEPADLPERPADASTEQLARWLADDLKAFYSEARMTQVPNAHSQQISTWLWGETALGQLLRQVRDRMKAAGDPALDAIAFGVAR